MLNSDNNERNNRNSSLNLVFPRLRREIEVGGGGRTFGHGEGNKIVECSPKFFKGDWMCTQFKKTLIDYYASS